MRPESAKPERMREYGTYVEKQTVRGAKGQMLKTGHCDVCGAVIAISADGTPFSRDDPSLEQHRLWHAAIAAAIADAKVDGSGA